MIETTLKYSPIPILAVFLAWFVKGLLSEIRDELARRATHYFLPAGQPSTFRIACWIIVAARALSPKHKFVSVPIEGKSPARPPIARSKGLVSWGVEATLRGLSDSAEFTGYRLEMCEWNEPSALLSELDEDLRSEKRVMHPLLDAWSLVRIALRERLVYSAQFASWLVPTVSVIFPAVLIGSFLLLILLPGILAVGVVNRRRQTKRPLAN